MAHQDIDVRAESSAPPEDVFALLADGATWPVWSPIGSFQLEEPARGGGEGVGAIRVFRTGRTTSRERVVEVVPDRRFSYALLSGIPIRDYRADVDLTRTPSGGTAIRWHSTFTAKIPGTGGMIRRKLHAFIGECVRGLAQHAAARANA
ncbi:MAG TPA: SRPBCC family protein [Acidimicrobiia bacterium]|nr:SRPBCC family protein [Acidimicrobiia bacterium]